MSTMAFQKVSTSNCKIHSLRRLIVRKSMRFSFLSVGQQIVCEMKNDDADLFHLTVHEQNTKMCMKCGIKSDTKM